MFTKEVSVSDHEELLNEVRRISALAETYKRRQTWTSIVVVSAVLAFMVFVGFRVQEVLGGGFGVGASQSAENALAVTDVSYKLISRGCEDQCAPEIVAVGTLKKTGDRPVTDIEMRLSWLDREGNLVDVVEESVWGKTLDTKETLDFRASGNAIADSREQYSKLDTTFFSAKFAEN